MNDRLENILYQSGLTAQGCWDELDSYAKQGIEKLAELIVKECCDVFIELRTRPADLAVLDVKKHFGIEQ